MKFQFLIIIFISGFVCDIGQVLAFQDYKMKATPEVNVEYILEHDPKMQELLNQVFSKNIKNILVKNALRGKENTQVVKIWYAMSKAEKAQAAFDRSNSENDKNIMAQSQADLAKELAELEKIEGRPWIESSNPNMTKGFITRIDLALHEPLTTNNGWKNNNDFSKLMAHIEQRIEKLRYSKRPMLKNYNEILLQFKSKKIDYTDYNCASVYEISDRAIAQAQASKQLTTADDPVTQYNGGTIMNDGITTVDAAGEVIKHNKCVTKSENDFSDPNKDSRNGPVDSSQPAQETK